MVCLSAPSYPDSLPEEVYARAGAEDLGIDGGNVRTMIGPVENKNKVHAAGPAPVFSPLIV